VRVAVWQMQAIRWMHYNLAGDHFIAVYGSHIAQVVGIELSMFDAGLLQTEQLSILGSAWCEGRQELVTAGGDGTLLFACLRTEYQITTNGRRLLSRLAPRMTISSGYLWMRQLCIDETEERVIAASDGTLCVWCMKTGGLLQNMSNLHANGAATLHLHPYPYSYPNSNPYTSTRNPKVRPSSAWPTPTRTRTPTPAPTPTLPLPLLPLPLSRCGHPQPGLLRGDAACAHGLARRRDQEVGLRRGHDALHRDGGAARPHAQGERHAVCC